MSNIVGVYKDDQGPIEGVVVKVELTDQRVYNNSTTSEKYTLAPFSSTDTTDSDGKWELNIPDTDSMNYPTWYKFTFTNGTEEEVVYKQVPYSIDDIDFEDL